MMGLKKENEVKKMWCRPSCAVGTDGIDDKGEVEVWKTEFAGKDRLSKEGGTLCS